MNNVEHNWYTLKRATPRFDPGQPDEWPSVTIDRHIALADFSKQLGFRLHFVDGDGMGEFILERRVAIPASHGTGWTPGDVIETFDVHGPKGST